MLMRRVTAKEKVDNGVVRAALVAGVASAVAVGSLSGVGPASGTCIGISGIDIGDGCTSSFGNFALGLGEGTVANSSSGFFNSAIAIGTNINAIAGIESLDFFNFAFNSGSASDGATSTVTAGNGGFNLASNLGGSANAGAGGNVGPQNMEIFAGDGSDNVAINIIGNRNRITAGGGILNFATNVGGFGGLGDPNTEIPNGSDNDITTTGGFSWASNSQTGLGETCPQGPCGNTVSATGPFSLVVAAGVVRRIVAGGPGITLANSFNSANFPPRTTWPPNTLAAQRNTSRPSPNFTPGLNSTSNLRNAKSSGGSALTSVSKQFNSSLKKLSAGVEKALGSVGKKKQNTEPKNSDIDG
jgi:hypothetical protein